MQLSNQHNKPDKAAETDTLFRCCCGSFLASLPLSILGTRNLFPTMLSSLARLIAAGIRHLASVLLLIPSDRACYGRLERRGKETFSSLRPRLNSYAIIILDKTAKATAAFRDVWIVDVGFSCLVRRLHGFRR